MILLAGFECGYLGWNNLDLLEANNHTPSTNMAENYKLAKSLTFSTVRDGLPWRHNVKDRLAIAKEQDMKVIWDCVHFDPAPKDVARKHAEEIANVEDDLLICPVNEPSIVPLLTDKDLNWAVETYKEYRNIISDKKPNTKYMTCDPINGAGDFQYEATDRIIYSGGVDMIGINYYPHDSVEPLSICIERTWKRYGKPILISETSWHVGHEEQKRRHPWCKGKMDWLSHILDEVKIATKSGIPVEGVCWYPILNSPSWDNDGTTWDNGLI